MAFCTKCGKELEGGATVCPNCGAPAPSAAPSVPAVQLKTNRGLIKYVLLSIITLGIYGLVVMSSVSTDINTIASRYDGKKTMHFCLLVFLVSSARAPSGDGRSSARSSPWARSSICTSCSRR